MWPRFQRFLLILLLLLSTQAQAFTLPPQFDLIQKWLSLTLSFDIEADGEKIGVVHRRLLSLRTEYDLYNVENELQATAKIRWLSLLTTFDVTDPADQPLGRVEQNLTLFFPTFEIFSADNRLLAVAEMNFWGTKYIIKEPVTNLPMACLSRPFIRLKDTWKVEITNPLLFLQKNINPMLFVTVMALQTDRDSWKSESPLAETPISCSCTQLPLAPPYDELEDLRATIEEYRLEYQDVAQESDFERVALLLDPFLQEERELAELLEELLTFIESDQLTPAEKSALLTLLEQKASSLY